MSTPLLLLLLLALCYLFSVHDRCTRGYYRVCVCAGLDQPKEKSLVDMSNGSSPRVRMTTIRTTLDTKPGGCILHKQSTGLCKHHPHNAIRLFPPLPLCTKLVKKRENLFSRSARKGFRHTCPAAVQVHNSRKYTHALHPFYSLSFILSFSLSTLSVSKLQSH